MGSRRGGSRREEVESRVEIASQGRHRFSFTKAAGQNAEAWRSQPHRPQPPHLASACPWQPSGGLATSYLTHLQLPDSRLHRVSRTLLHSVEPAAVTMSSR